MPQKPAATMERKRGKAELPLAAIYARLSDVDDTDSLSLEAQVVECRRKAAELGYRVDEDHIYVENFTGRLLSERPILSRLRGFAKQGAYAAILVYRFDRISRKQAQRIVLFQELETNQCKVISATEHIEDSSGGRFMQTILGAVAEYETEVTLERSALIRRRLKEKGMPMCQGNARFGYRYVKATRTREVVPDEAKIVRRIFALYLKQNSSDTIADILNNEGVPSPAKKRGIRESTGWFGSTVRAILKDRSYVGDPLVSGKRKATEKRSIEKERADGSKTRAGRVIYERAAPDEWWAAKDPTPRIIDDATFEAAQSLLKSRKIGDHTRNLQKPFLLRGYVKCAVCGQAMTAVTHTRPGKVYEYYECNSRQLKRYCGSGCTPVGWLDALIWDFIETTLSDSGRVEEMFRKALGSQGRDDFSAELKSHRAAVAKCEAAIKRLVTTLGNSDDETVAEMVQAEVAKNTRVKQTHLDEISHLESKVASIENREAALRRFVDVVRKAKSSLKHATLEQKRLLFEALELKVFAKRKQVQIRVCVDFVKVGSDSGSGASRISPAARRSAKGGTTTRP